MISLHYNVIAKFWIFVINSKVTSLSVVATGGEHLFSEDREETGSLVQRVDSHNTIIRGATLSGHIIASWWSKCVLLTNKR